MVKEIQKGHITKPEEVAAAAATAAGDCGGGGGEGSPGEGEEEGPLAHDWLLAEQVVQQQSSAGQVKVRHKGVGGAAAQRARRAHLQGGPPRWGDDTAQPCSACPQADT